MVFPVISILSLSALVAWIEATVVRLSIHRFGQLVGKTLLTSFVVFHIVLIVAEYLLYSFTGLLFGQESLYLLTETNAREVGDFTKSYLSIHTIICLIVISSIGIWLAHKSLVLFLKKSIMRFMQLMGISGMIILGYGAYSFIFRHDGLSIPQHTNLTRLVYGFYTLRQNNTKLLYLVQICRDCEAHFSEGTDTIPHIVVVIGESSSLHHCSVYGYEKNTWPRIDSLRNKGELIAYDHVQTSYDATNWVMRDVFSVDPSCFSRTPLFPAVFRSVGYTTTMIENQYFLREGMTFLCDTGVSNALFEQRIDGPFVFDGDIIPLLPTHETNSLDIIHLVGQHFAYEDRYPKAFSCFQPHDYDEDRFTENQRKIIAHYDNAALYCDYVLNQIINHYRNQDCLMVFFSDHGEEVFETRDYYGHCSASTAPDASFLFDIPFFIWFSSEFAVKHPKLVESFRQECHDSFSTSHFSEWLLSKSGIELMAK